MRFDPEPRRVLGLSRDAVSTESFYCCYCGTCMGSSFASSMRAHIKNQHDEEDAFEGEDFVHGWQALLMNERHDRWREREEKRAANMLASLRGPDDFLLECENDA